MIATVPPSLCLAPMAFKENDGKNFNSEKKVARKKEASRSSSRAVGMERLETLKLLFEKGFISPSEYDERRRQIVDDITKTTLLATPNETISPTAFHGEQPTPFPPVCTRKTMTNFLPPDEEEGFGSKQKAVEEEENFGPKPKHSLQTLNICPNTTTTSTYQPSDFEQEEKELAKEMDITEKYELSRQIGCLPGNCLRMVLEIVKETSPEALEKVRTFLLCSIAKCLQSGEDWIFDLKTLPSVTLWKLHDYIEAWNKEDNKELGSQGEEKQVLAAAVLTPSEDRTSLSLDTQSRTKGIKRPRALPGTPAKQEKRVTRTIKKSKIASSSSDEDEENETEPAGMVTSCSSFFLS